MSNYSAPTRHPVTGAIEMADWLDDSFGRHAYGVRFEGEEKIYPGKDCAEISPDEMLEEIERLRAALRALITHTLDCEKQLDEFHGIGNDAGSGMSSVVCEARAALGKKTND